MHLWAYADGAPDTARLGRVELARSCCYGLRSPRPIRLVRRIPAHTPIHIKPLAVDSVAAQLVAGLALGGVYALLALALVLVHRSSGVVNIAQGGMAMLSAFVCATLVSHGWAFWPAFGATVLLSFAGGAAVHATLVRPLRHGPALAATVLTVGLLLACNGFATWVWGPDRRRFAWPFSSGQVTIAGAAVGRSDLAVAGLTLGAAALAWLLLARSRLGLALRASAANALGARYAGIHVGATVAVGWGFAAGLGAVAGVAAAGPDRLAPTMLGTAFLFALAAAAVGGLDSAGVAVAAALGLGVTVELVRVHVDALAGGVPAAVGLGVLLAAVAARRW